MKKIKMLIAFLIVFVSPSLFYVDGIYGYLQVSTDSSVNSFSLNDKTSYTVIHETMNLDGTYTEYSSVTYNNVLLGTTVSPSVLTLTGFDSPNQQSVTLNTYENTIIRYRYPRHSYTLTINDSNYVTTNTPSGSYLYGTEIHLIADAVNNLNSPFAKWSNDVTNRDYTFTLTSDVTIGPIYSGFYQVTFEPNNGDSPIIRNVVDGDNIGLFPVVTNDDCTNNTGPISSRGCTYYEQLLGWYSDPDFLNPVDETFIPTANTTLYAKWNRVYFASNGPTVFDGTNYIDTLMQLFNEENAEKDFLVTVSVDSNNGYTDDRGAIFADMKEGAEPYPGVQFFYTGNNYVMNANALGHKKKQNISFTTGQDIKIKRENGVISYSINGGNYVTFNDISSFNQYFDIKATFGAEYGTNGAPYRYFKGTLSDMSVQLFDLDSYIVHFDANGGTGTMNDQSIPVNRTVNLNANLFTKDGYLFAGWNTAPDGSGTSYTNREQVTALGNKDDVITLYAQWVQSITYTVHFDANGGSGSMADQTFNYNDPPVALNQNTFTKTGYVFRGWNTAPDGSGTSYKDQEEVRNLTAINNSLVNLYAQYMRVAYNYTGTYVFNGTSDFIDTGVNLYDQNTIDKDFEIRFTVVDVAPDINYQNQATIINCKDESNPKWPGFNVRFNTNSGTNMVPGYRWSGNTGTSTTLPAISTSRVPVQMVIKRVNGVVTFSYSYQGYESQETTMFNQASWTLDRYFADNLSFGGIYDSTHNRDRFFKGTLADMIVLVDD